MCSRSGWRAAASALLAAGAVLVAGCGGGPAPAERLARLADDVAAALAAGDSCGAARTAARLQRETVRAVNSRQLPADRLEELVGGVNELRSKVRCGHVSADAAAVARRVAASFRGAS